MLYNVVLVSAVCIDIPHHHHHPTPLTHKRDFSNTKSFSPYRTFHLILLSTWEGAWVDET